MGRGACQKDTYRMRTSQSPAVRVVVSSCALIFRSVSSLPVCHAYFIIYLKFDATRTTPRRCSSDTAAILRTCWSA